VTTLVKRSRTDRNKKDPYYFAKFPITIGILKEINKSALSYSTA